MQHEAAYMKFTVVRYGLDVTCGRVRKSDSVCLISTFCSC